MFGRARARAPARILPGDVPVSWRRRCRVIGIDLTDAYCALARRISEWVGLAQRTEFRQGDALRLPFEDGSFALAWTEHAQMNIPDKQAFYSEIHRVLRTGGRLAFHDWFRAALQRIRGEGPPPLGIHLRMGEDSRAKLENMVRNLEERRIVVAMAVMSRT